jgi:hypothetical protein
MVKLKKSSDSHPRQLLLITLAVIWFSRLLTLLAFPYPVSAPDSGTYYSGKFLDFSLVSLQGHASRGWVVPLIYSIMPNAFSLELAQLCISGFAWSFLAIEGIRTRYLTTRFNNYFLVAVAILSSTSQVIQHDTTVLATSITNSLFIVLITLLLGIKFNPSMPKTKLFSILAISILLSIQKATFLPFALVAILLGIFSIRSKLTSAVKVSYFAFAIFAGVFVSMVSFNVNNTWQVSYSGQTLLWQLGGQSPIASEFGEYLVRAKAPDCITRNVPFENLDISIGEILNDCPAGSRFIETSIQKEFFSFALTHPGATSKLAIFGMGAALTDSASNYGNAVNILPKWLSGIFFGESFPSVANSNVDSQVAGMNFLNSGTPFWIYAPLITWVLLGICGVLVSTSSRKDSLYLLVIMVACLIQALTAVVLLPSEWVRQTAPFVLGTLVISVFLTMKLVETISSTSTNSDK